MVNRRGRREFGTVGVFGTCGLFGCGTFCYVMWVMGLLALTAGTAAAAADCGADLNDGGEALAAAQVGNLWC